MSTRAQASVEVSVKEALMSVARVRGSVIPTRERCKSARARDYPHGSVAERCKRAWERDTHTRALLSVARVGESVK